jgi:DNA-binding Lrp family transcriptional regulator
MLQIIRCNPRFALDSSSHEEVAAVPTQDPRRHPRAARDVDTGGLDAIDRALVSELVRDGRITNAALAARAGIAESTCLARVKALREAGVITGIHARVDPAALGLPIQAIIRVRLTSHVPDHVLRFHRTLREIPGLITAFHTAGADDYLLHVAVKSPAALRALILEHVTVQPGVSHTETQLLFEVFVAGGVV